MATSSVTLVQGRYSCGQCGASVIRGACGRKSAWTIIQGHPIRALRFCSWCPACGAFAWGTPPPSGGAK